MVVLRTLGFAYLATACYSPDVRDCTVTCNQLSDCAPGQVCGEDGFCAAEEIAGRCAQIAAPTDAGIDAPKPHDARPDAEVDALPTVKLWVRIDGRGVVSIPGVGDCDGGSGQTECAFDVIESAQLTLHATPKNNWSFDRWSEACDGQLTSTCVIALSASGAVRARFVLVDDSL